MRLGSDICGFCRGVRSWQCWFVDQPHRCFRIDGTSTDDVIVV